MNKKLLLILFIILLAVAVVSFYSWNQLRQDKSAVRSVVENFGKTLQNVSLLSPTLAQDMEENYKDFLDPTLLAQWKEDPSKALGRLTSSPWPDGIEISSIEQFGSDTYDVNGNIIEITSVEEAQKGIPAKRPIRLSVVKFEDRWLITSVSLGEYQETGSVLYRNAQYGFSFALPKSWSEYSIVTDVWQGDAPGGPQVAQGPIILIRHPDWTSENPRQDIPIMVFTYQQWETMQQGEFHIGAAPINPSELGRNNTYVFALPARYNYAFPAGYEEVDEILQNDPLQIFDSTAPFIVQGTVVCLPHRDTGGPITMECAFGLKDDQGNYYALYDPDPDYGKIGDIFTGAYVQITGLFEPGSHEKYQSIGTIEIWEVDIISYQNF
jgi:type II secretory pathway pseudopilin PulG